MKSKNAADDAVISRIYCELVKRPGSDVLRYYSIPRRRWAAFILQTLPQAGHSRTTLKAVVHAFCVRDSLPVVEKPAASAKGSRPTA